jgi:hypothetical protein
MTNEQFKRVKNQLLQGEESLRKHYDFSDISTLVGLINTCINIMQQDEDFIEIMEANNNTALCTIESLESQLETEKKLRQIVMQDLSDKSKELFKTELKYKLYKTKQEGQI